jgi:uncharacterized protein (DUF2126 family)
MLFPKEYKEEEEEEEDDKKNKRKHLPFQEKKEEKSEYKPLYDVFTIKTALVSEIRDGKIHLFLPPVEMIEHYLDLLAAIELTCEELQIPVIIEGYTPPKDKRIEKLMVTPDPGRQSVERSRLCVRHQLVGTVFRVQVSAHWKGQI